MALWLALPVLIVGGVLAVGWFRGSLGGSPVAAPPQDPTGYSGAPVP